MSDRHATWDAINEAWDALYDSLPARWHVGKPSYNPERKVWSVTAWGPLASRGKAPRSVSGTGEDEAAALRDLDDRLRRVRQPRRGRVDELRQQLRMAYVEGAEAWAMENDGRSLTLDELRRVIGRHAGR